MPAAYVAPHAVAFVPVLEGDRGQGAAVWTAGTQPAHDDPLLEDHSAIDGVHPCLVVEPRRARLVLRVDPEPDRALPTRGRTPRRLA